MDDLERAEHGRDLTAGLEYELRQLDRERLWMEDEPEPDDVGDDVG